MLQTLKLQNFILNYISKLENKNYYLINGEITGLCCLLSFSSEYLLSHVRLMVPFCLVFRLFKVVLLKHIKSRKKFNISICSFIKFSFGECC